MARTSTDEVSIQAMSPEFSAGGGGAAAGAAASWAKATAEEARSIATPRADGPGDSRNLEIILIPPKLVSIVDCQAEQRGEPRLSSR
jgi:hypothetical protein